MFENVFKLLKLNFFFYIFDTGGGCPQLAF